MKDLLNHQENVDGLGRRFAKRVLHIEDPSRPRPALSAEEGWTGVEISRPVKLDELRKKLAAEPGGFWRSLEEAADSKGFEQFIQNEFPRMEPALDGVNRRDFLKLAGAGMAMAGLTACNKQPIEKIVPYVRPPEQVIPGKPLHYATAMAQDGYGFGLLATSHLGRPTKLEGNPEHPASLGATNLFGQAAVLDLWDPDRSQAVLKLGRIGTFDQFQTEIESALNGQALTQGGGIRILSETVTSPSLAAELEGLLQKFPSARWVQYSPCGRDMVRAGALLAFGEHVEPVYEIEAADLIVSLDADFLSTGPAHIRYAREFAARRDPSHARGLNRLFVAECTPSNTGACAEHRIPVAPSQVEALARAIARGVGLPAPGGEPEADAHWVEAVVADLKAHGGRSLVIAGDQQPAAVHALAHAINERLGNAGRTVRYLAPVEAAPQDQGAAFRQLADDMANGLVQVLVVLGGNPVYSAPADLRFGEAIRNVKMVAHLSSHYNETSRLSHWHLPEAHFLETWGDVRAFDGTVSLVQPLILPIYQGRSALELVRVLRGLGAKPGYDLLREYWLPRLGNDEGAWRKALHDGMVPGTAAEAKPVSVATVPEASAASAAGIEILFRPSPAVGDGSHANNGWLQETPLPLSRVVWDNPILISPALAERKKVRNEDLLEIQYRGRTVSGPAWILPGQPENTLTVTLGYGRTHAGRVGNGVGFSAYALRTADAPWSGSGVVFVNTGRKHLLAATGHQHAIQQDISGMLAPDVTAAKRNLVRVATLDYYKAHADFAQHPHHEHPAKPEDSLFRPPVDYSKGEQWGMAINLAACIGCNACSIACVAENNSPVVGKEQVRAGRDMRWIRVDRYYGGSIDNPEAHHQPVNCQHCENAPCEPVCPVGATVHSHDGLNQMVYNRCVGTRYCANNCPFKVRRFNYYQFTDLKTESLKFQRNPNVTVRVRGVMEKCTYCVQRIRAAQIEAKKANRPIRDGEVVTACQQVCPTRAIAFGNINDPNSEVSRLKARDLNYALISDLNLGARTTYLAKVTNPHPALAAAPSKEKH